MSVDGIACTTLEADWPFASEQAAAINRHWAMRRAEKPDLFDGKVLLLASGDLLPGHDGSRLFRGSCLEADFRAFMAWREFGFPATTVRNIFAMAAIETADGAFLLGEMAGHTATAGQIYFPSGTPDLADVHGPSVDIEGSARRELLEETGLGETDVAFEAGFTLMMDPIRVCCMKRVRSPEGAETLQARIQAWLAHERKPEFLRMHAIRTTSDLVPAIPSFVSAYIRHRLERLRH